MLGTSFKRQTLKCRYGRIPKSVFQLFSTNSEFFKVSEEVRDALHSKKPVVALETTIYTHGKDNLHLLRTRSDLTYFQAFRILKILHCHPNWNLSSVQMAVFRPPLGSCMALQELDSKRRS